MNYYFDESGNWSGNENKSLVLGGLLLSKRDLKELERDFRLLKAEKNIKTLHAMDLKNNIKEEVYNIINTILNDNSKGLVRIFKPEVLLSKTQKSKEDIYSDLAAKLVSEISFGDEKVNIYYDMKFHYAYPLNILKEISEKKPFYYKNMMKSFFLSKETFLKNKNKIQNKIGKLINRSGISNSEYLLYSQFLTLLPNENYKDYNNLVARYLWTELQLQIEGKEVAREKFRNNILNNIKHINSLFHIDMIPDLFLKFEDKSSSNSGIEAVDFICNLVYRYGRYAPLNSSNVVKNIYSKIKIEEVEL